MARSYKSTLINRHRSAVRAEVECSWAGGQPLNERKSLKKNRDMYRKRFLIYAEKVEDDMQKFKDILCVVQSEVMSSRDENGHYNGRVAPLTLQMLTQTLGITEP